MVGSATPRKPTSGAAAKAATSDGAHLKHKRRYCREEGCNRIVKSQGLCQRHGAKVRQCSIPGCNKGAQGNFDKMCKSHFKEMRRKNAPIPKVMRANPPPPPEGISAYDNILPICVDCTVQGNSVNPLIAHLKAGFDARKPTAWHRNEERRARGMYTVDNPATQLEGWERELVWMEILILTGAPGASFRHLARGWGRDKGFHMVLAQYICERQGDVQRKKRMAEKVEAAVKSRGPAKKRGRPTKGNQSDPEASSDFWGGYGSIYHDTMTDEALAANTFEFSAQELEKYDHERRKRMAEEENSDEGSVASQESDSDRKIKAKKAPLQIPPVHGGNPYTDAGHLHRQPIDAQGQYMANAQSQYVASPPEGQLAAVTDRQAFYSQHASTVEQPYGQQRQYSQLHENQKLPQDVGRPKPQYDPAAAPGRYRPPDQSYDPRPEHPEQNPETSALGELSNSTNAYSLHDRRDEY